MELYRPNATTEDLDFLAALDTFKQSGYPVLPVSARTRHIGIPGATPYIVHKNGDVVRIDAKGSFYIGRI